MTILQKRISSAIAAGTLLVQVALPAFAADTIQISGNGVGSDNFTTVTQTSTTQVTQSNTAVVSNVVDADAETGGNESSFNTGGDQVISSGPATTDVTVVNTLNSNAALVDCCAAGDTAVKIAGNGVGSDSTVALTQASAVDVNQDNVAVVTNDVDADAKTGRNDASLNTGGDTTIVTGAATTNVDVTTEANSNFAKVGGPSAAAVPTVSLWITDNGAFSDNFINAVLAKTTDIEQDNTAVISNYVDADAKTGSNDTNFNTGGDATILTGPANAGVEIDNMVNFNYASVDCGCTWNVLAKIDGNGANVPFGDHKDLTYGAQGFDHLDLPWWWLDGGDNVINLTAASAQLYGQDNVADLYNEADANAKTGYNTENLNTGDGGADPVTVTGAAHDNVDVSNTGNVNTIGGSPLFTWPLGGSELNVSFNLNALLALWGHLVG